MARFISGCSGRAKSAATRLGTANKPCRAYARGWDIGARVWAGPENPDKKGPDIVELCIDGGSNNTRILLNLGCWQRANDGTVLPTTHAARIIYAALKEAGLA